MWKQGGGTVWGWVSYDPELNLVYYGTSNPGPWNSSMRPGDNLWTAGVFARDATTGQAKWYYQFSPHDMSDYDGVNENILIDLPTAGGLQKALVHPDRNGHVYVIDRTNGRADLGQPLPSHHVQQGRRHADGRLIYNDEKQPQVDKFVKDICPRAARRQGLAAVGVLAQERPPLHPPQQPVHGHQGDRGRLHRRHALRRR